MPVFVGKLAATQIVFVFYRCVWKSVR